MSKSEKKQTMEKCIADYEELIKKYGNEYFHTRHDDFLDYCKRMGYYNPKYVIMSWNYDRDDNEENGFISKKGKITHSFDKAYIFYDYEKAEQYHNEHMNEWKGSTTSTVIDTSFASEIFINMMSGICNDSECCCPICRYTKKEK